MTSNHHVLRTLYDSRRVPAKSAARDLDVGTNWCGTVRGRSPLPVDSEEILRNKTRVAIMRVMHW